MAQLQNKLYNCKKKHNGNFPLPSLRCLDFDDDEKVVKFARNAKDHLEEMDDKEYFTVLYIGETSDTIRNRMRKNLPCNTYPGFHART